MSELDITTPAKDEFDGTVFEEKSNRLVWIAPSVLLHVVIVAMWILTPDNEPINRKERKLVVKSEQAELLQKHVEDANLLELHAELSELQKIKAAMAKIRKQKLTELVAFEDELQAQLPDDIRESVKAITKAQAGVVAKQKQSQVAVDEYEKAVAAIRPQAVIEKLAALQDPLKQVKAKQQLMDKAFENSRLKLEHIGQLVVRAQTMLEWVQDETVLTAWRDFEAKHKRAIELNDDKEHEIRQRFAEHHKSIDDLADNAKDYATFLISTTKRATEATQQYEKKKKEIETHIADSVKKVAEQKAAIAQLALDEPRLKRECDQLKKEIDGMPNKTKGDRGARNRKNAELRKRRIEWERAKRAGYRKKKDIKRFEREKVNRGRTLARLKPYQMNKKDKLRIDRINAFLTALRQPVSGSAKLIDEAIAAQEQANQAAAEVWKELAAMFARQTQQAKTE